jgi:nitroreductase
MDFFDVVRARRSVRHYRPDPIDPALVDQVLEAGILAPTAGNRQPWTFVVIERDAALKQGVVRTTFRGNSWLSGKAQEWLLEAPVLIVVCAEVERSISRYGWRQAQELITEDVSAAVENMLLAAVALGLGSCWIGGFDPVALGSCLDLPPLVSPIAILPLGFAAVPANALAKRALAEVIRARL